MALGEHGEIATSVNARQWITLRRTTPPGDPEQDGRIVLPPDAGADAGLAPVLGCPFDAPARECMADAYPVLVGESEWISGYIRHVAGSGFHFEFAALFGPTGRIVDLQKLGDEQWLTGVVPQPGGVFIGLDGKHEGDDTRHFRPVLWRAPDFAREDLPIRGFDEGPWPQQVNAEGRIVGSGIVPSRDRKSVV